MGRCRTRAARAAAQTCGRQRRAGGCDPRYRVARRAGVAGRHRCGKQAAQAGRTEEYPPHWFEVPSDITLKRLHDVIQRGFGWQDRHLFVFETEIGRYSVPDPDSNGPGPDFRNAASKKLSAVADWPGDRILYVYDFGDAWEHDILVEAVMPAGPGVDYPRCTAGRRAGAPEDCGGPSGYRELLNVLANQRSPQHAAMLQSLGIESAADFDPEYFSAAHVNAELSYMSKVLVWH